MGLLSQPNLATLKSEFKGHLGLLIASKLMYFDRNINENI